MKVSVDVYTQDLEAAVSAYAEAIKSGAYDVSLTSNHDWSSKKLECFNLRFEADHSNTAIQGLDSGPFRTDTEFG